MRIRSIDENHRKKILQVNKRAFLHNTEQNSPV